MKQSPRSLRTLRLKLEASATVYEEKFSISILGKNIKIKCFELFNKITYDFEQMLECNQAIN